MFAAATAVAEKEKKKAEDEAESEIEPEDTEEEAENEEEDTHPNIQMLEQLEVEMEKQLKVTKGLTKKEMVVTVAGKELEQFPRELVGPGPGEALNGWPNPEMVVSQAKDDEAEVKEFVKMGFVKEDFENSYKLRELICQTWKKFTTAREVFEKAASTFGIKFVGKCRRKVLMKVIGLLSARRERIAAMSVGGGGMTGATAGSSG